MAQATMTQTSAGKAHLPSVRLRLRCARCGTSAEYDVGTVLMEPTSTQAGAGRVAYSFTGYFRCQHCNSPGPWEVVDRVKLLGLRVRAKLSPRFPGLRTGHHLLSDGTKPQTTAMAEEHLLAQLRDQPRNAALHRRLGNVLRWADQPAKAREWYSKALALDATDAESHHHLFELAFVAGDIPAMVLHARALTRVLLDGQATGDPKELALGAAAFVEDLRGSPEGFRRYFLGDGYKRSQRPEDVFIRTLLTEDGEEEDILAEATQRLLDGVARPSLLEGDKVVSQPPGVISPPPRNAPSLELFPSLAEVVQTEGLNPAKLVLAFDVPDGRHIRVQDKHQVFVSDGQKAAVWPVPALAELFRGDKEPPPHMDYFPEEYVPHFAVVETQWLGVCDILGDRTDQEMEEIYSALRRRPDGRSLGVEHDLMWQILALLLGQYVISVAEYEGLVGALLTSARRWGQKPVSRNYMAYLRGESGHARPDRFLFG